MPPLPSHSHLCKGKCTEGRFSDLAIKAYSSISAMLPEQGCCEEMKHDLLVEVGISMAAETHYYWYQVRLRALNDETKTTMSCVL